MTIEKIISIWNEQITELEGTIEAYKEQIKSVKNDVRDLKRAMKLLGVK